MAKRQGIMLAYPFDERKLERISRPWIIQPKINGHRCRVVIDYNEPKATLYSSSGAEIKGVPHITASYVHYHPYLKGLELDGELYVHGMPIELISGICKTQIGQHPSYLKMEHHLFDVIDVLPQAARIDKLHRLPVPDYIKKLPSYLAESMDELLKIFTAIIDDGYEGIIIRDPLVPYYRKKTTTMLKLKPFYGDNEEFEIVGWQQEYDIYGRLKEGRLGAFKLRDNQSDETFDVGSGFTQQQRMLFWQDREHLLGKKVRIKYQARSDVRQVPTILSFKQLLD